MVIPELNPAQNGSSPTQTDCFLPSTSFPFAPSQPGSLAVTPHSSHVFPTSQPSPVRRPPMSRAHSHSLSLHSKPYSLNTGASSPFFLTPQPSSVNVSAPRTLLMPTVRQTRHATATAPPSPKPQSQRSPRSGLSRSRTSSVVPGTANPPDSICTTSLPDWIGGGCRFEVVADNIYLEGYQLYAVEKWLVRVVERSRPVTVLAVFTDRRDRTQSSQYAVTLRGDSRMGEGTPSSPARRARPKDTERGVIMVTSLANFRSDFTIVHIPKGDFLDVREQLYSNINVLRMGCSGRSALTLGEPSDTTKDRFLSMYHLSDNVLARTQAVFNSTVLEFIKLIQTSLAICGMFPLLHDERNGLLCDVTLEGIHTWVTDIGEPLMEMEPLERTLDPAVVAALFSTILTIRIKLQALGHPVPKDPLIDPMSFIKSLHSFQSSLKPNSHSHSISLSHHSSHNTPVPPTSSTLSSSTTPSTLSPAGAPGDGTLYLTYPLILAISSAYDKLKQSESYKVHRVLINKLDDLATDLRTSESSKSKSKSGGWWGQGNAFNNNQPSSDLAVFVKCVVSGAGAASTSSLRYLWTGRPEEVGRKRREKEVLEDGELAGEGDGKGDKDKDKEKEKEKAEKEKDKEREREGGKERMSYDRDVKSSEDEGDLGGYSTSKPWSGRVQRKIEVWTALGRAKKLSADFGAKGRAFVSPESLPGATQSTTQLLPSVVISRDPADEDDVLSSGQVSPVYSQRLSMMRGLGVYPNSQRSANELLEYDRRVTEFDARRPPTKSQFQTRIISWSDPVTARGLLDDEDSTPFGGSGRKRPSPLHDSVLGGDNDDMQSGTGTLVEDDGEGEGSLGSTDIRRQRTILLKKRRSFDDADRVRDTVRLLTPERMRIDVELR
ncbi:hypothetical protein EUX98_g9387 [Antrodiella citrinella]|uniref:STB6-like N-terminal domain-containing protein n=1 Tax=Antrodiella citrinella TaxID=2447956 RepID=A0A4S4LTX4_9APHY|nr:hypothetical protein EUX98_g9387 [Antrodiella citrinella]